VDKKELLEDVQQWIRRMDELYPDAPKEKLYFNVSYHQMQDILSVLEQRTRVIVCIQGGVCQMVKANELVSVDVLDEDNWRECEAGSEEDQNYRALDDELDELNFIVY
jgi:hypothetical protein